MKGREEGNSFGCPVPRGFLFSRKIEYRKKASLLLFLVKKEVRPFLFMHPYLKGLQVIDGLRMKTKGEAGSIDGEKIKL